MVWRGASMFEEFLGQNSARGNLKLSTHIKWFKVVLLPCKSTPYQFSSITTNFPPKSSPYFLKEESVPSLEKENNDNPQQRSTHLLSPLSVISI